MTFRMFDSYGNLKNSYENTSSYSLEKEVKEIASSTITFDIDKELEIKNEDKTIIADDVKIKTEAENKPKGDKIFTIIPASGTYTTEFIKTIETEELKLDDDKFEDISMKFEALTIRMNSWNSFYIKTIKEIKEIMETINKNMEIGGSNNMDVDNFKKLMSRNTTWLYITIGISVVWFSLLYILF